MHAPRRTSFDEFVHSPRVNCVEPLNCVLGSVELMGSHQERRMTFRDIAPPGVVRRLSDSGNPYKPRAFRTLPMVTGYKNSHQAAPLTAREAGKHPKPPPARNNGSLGGTGAMSIPSWAWCCL